MNPIVKKDILNVLRQTISLIKKQELLKLRELSDHVIKNASVFQDKYSISIAITIYSISKIYRNSKEVDDFIITHLNNTVKFLEEGNLNDYESELKKIIKDISEKDSQTKFYIQEVLERAQIKKASKMFEHGISMGLVADILGVSQWDLMDYIGKTRIMDNFEHKTNTKKKLEFARSLFS